jgi:hypothetical protein
MFEATLDTTIGDDEQRWHFVDAETLCEVGPLIDIHVADEEGAVVLAPLEHLGYVALHAPASTVELGVEEDEPRVRLSAMLHGADSLT